MCVALAHVVLSFDQRYRLTAALAFTNENNPVQPAVSAQESQMAAAKTACKTSRVLPLRLPTLEIEINQLAFGLEELLSGISGNGLVCDNCKWRIRSFDSIRVFSGVRALHSTRFKFGDDSCILPAVSLMFMPAFVYLGVAYHGRL